jgi:hypothetical protein
MSWWNSVCVVWERRESMALSLMRISRGIYNVVLRYTEYVIPFFLSSPFLLLFENKLWYYTNLVKQWYAKQVILILKFW